MKTMISLLLLLSVSVTTTVATEVHPSFIANKSAGVSFNFFRAHRQGSGIALSWATSSGNVAQFIIERSYDGEYFDQIGGMACNGRVTHKFTDSNVFPGIIYYRITAVKTDGTAERSPVQSVRIVKHG